MAENKWVEPWKMDPDWVDVFPTGIFLATYVRLAEVISGLQDMECLTPDIKWPQKKVDFFGWNFFNPKITGVITSPYTPWKFNSEFTPENRIIFQAIHFCRGKTVKLSNFGGCTYIKTWWLFCLDIPRRQ